LKRRSTSKGYAKSQHARRVSFSGPGKEAQFFCKTSGTASLAPFLAIQKKYAERTERERRRATAALVEDVRTRRERALNKGGLQD
jgi:hypothetical protein